MRAASRISGLICEFLGGHRFDGISHSTVQNYLLRVGLDQIVCGRDRSCSDRVWIMDHMIAAGSLKCLVVLSISADKFARLGRPLQHQDIEVLELIPTEVSNGPVVDGQLNRLADRVGVPKAILSDRGSDLKKGVELFQQRHRETIALYDIVHLVCRLIWKRLGKEDRFDEYRKASCECANKIRQSALAHLKPPRPKTKARYMNLDPEIRWGRRALWLLDRVRSGNLTPRQKARLDPTSVEAALGWLDAYREELGDWAAMCKVGQTSCAVVRRCGYSEQTVSELKTALGSSDLPAVEDLIAEILMVVEDQCSRCEGSATRFPGSSEVIESIIGKGKRLLGTSQNNNSLTGQILSLAASTVKFSVSGLSETLGRCRIGHVRGWIKDHIASGIHTARREDLTSPDSGTNVAQTESATTPAF